MLNRQTRHPAPPTPSILFLGTALLVLRGFRVARLVPSTKRPLFFLLPFLPLHLLNKICGAISYMHQQRIMHRDLKPANIFLNLKGQVCLRIRLFRRVKGSGQNANKT